jgi:uncharacterized protein YutE (UPF0331/DUF86 family)
MSELLLRKLLACRARIERVRRALPQNPDEVLTDERLEAFISFHTFLLLQDASGLAVHLLAERGLGIPASQRDAFELLADAGLITRDLVAAMGAAIGLRNRIAHRCGDIDPVRLVKEAPLGLDAVGRFLDQLATIA